MQSAGVVAGWLTKGKKEGVASVSKIGVLIDSLFY
jgi:hypothetical protein